MSECTLVSIYKYSFTFRRSILVQNIRNKPVQRVIVYFLIRSNRDVSSALNRFIRFIEHNCTIFQGELVCIEKVI